MCLYEHCKYMKHGHSVSQPTCTKLVQTRPFPKLYIDVFPHFIHTPHHQFFPYYKLSPMCHLRLRKLNCGRVSLTVEQPYALLQAAICYVALENSKRGAGKLLRLVNGAFDKHFVGPEHFRVCISFKYDCFY